MTARRTFLLLIGSCGLFLRLALLARSPGNYDTESYRLTAAAAVRGQDIWAGGRYNYSPLWAGILVSTTKLAAVLGTSPEFAIGLLLLAGDAATAWLLYRLASRRGDGPRAAVLALLFFVNPVSVLTSSLHGQFDNLAILLLLLSLSARGREGPGLRSAAAVSGSLLVKHVAWFHPLLFAVRAPARRRWIWALPYAIFLISFLPYRAFFDSIRRSVFLYRGLSGNYGLEAIQLVLPGLPDWSLTALFVAAALAAVVLTRRADLARASLLLFLCELVFLPGFGRQYCVWPIALGSLFPGPGYLLYSVVAGCFLAARLDVIGLSRTSPGWYGPWWAALAWLLLEVRSLRKQAATQITTSAGATEPDART